MSITPVEEDEEGRNREAARQERPGVRARVRSWLGALCRRVSRLFRPTEDGERTESTRSGEIRVAGQQRLAANRESTADSDTGSTPPPARGTLPGSTGVDTKQEGQTLRVYDPEHEEAFISSDTWTDIEQ
jgi:hypothetical protein